MKDRTCESDRKVIQFPIDPAKAHALASEAMIRRLDARQAELRAEIDGLQGSVDSVDRIDELIASARARADRLESQNAQTCENVIDLPIDPELATSVYFLKRAEDFRERAAASRARLARLESQRKPIALPDSPAAWAFADYLIAEVHRQARLASDETAAKEKSADR